MGLAYNLDVTTWNDFGDFIPNAMVALANTDPTLLSVPGPGSDAFTGGGGANWEFRFTGGGGITEANTQYIFPTGEYILRDVAFINGMYVFCGSYKAYFRDLFGAGNHGYAWDGFIMTIRGYSYGTTATTPWLYQVGTRAFGGLYAAQEAGWGFMPMRMPMDISPGVIGDAAAIAADDSVGLQSLDIWKGGTDVEVGAPLAPDATNIKVLAVGFQKVGDPVAQGMTYTDIDYIGFMWCSQLLSTTDIGGAGATSISFSFSAQPYVGGDPATYPYNPATAVDGDYIRYYSARQSTYQVSWRATSNYSQFLPAGLPSTENVRLADLDQWCAVCDASNGGAGTYSIREWGGGYLPTGATWNGLPAIPVDVSCLTHEYYPRRFMDVAAWSETTNAGASPYESLSPWVIGGDVSLGGNAGDPTPVIDGIVPMVMGCSLPSEYGALSAVGLPATDKLVALRPFMILQPAGVSQRAAGGGGTSVWTFNGNFTLTNSFEGAYCAFTMIPYELATNFTVGGFNPSGRPPVLYLAVNDITDSGGNKGCGLFYMETQPQLPNSFAYSMLAPNQNPAPAVDLPDKWYGKLMQSRTFTVDEEARSKDLNYYGANPAGSDPEYVYNSVNNETVGVQGNYVRYGLDEDPTGEFAERKQMGDNSRQCYGLLGWDSAAGPICYLFDSGRGWEKSNTYPIGNPNYATFPQFSNVMMNKGDDFNAHFTLDPTSVNRKAIWAAWDNDRDQWMFQFSDPTRGIGSISATSTFQDTITSTAFLDQTANFALIAPTETTNYQTAMWCPFLMSNNMDGVVVYGGDNETNSKSGEIWGYTGDGAANKYWVYAVQQSTGSQTPDDSWYQAGAALTLDFNPSTLQWFNISGSTGRTARVWVDYILLDGADAVIATKIRERGMKVTIEAVEWFKRKIINSGDLNIKQEEIEMWMREQQDEFSQMMQDAERQGRVRKRKKQVSAYGLDVLENINTDFEDKEVQEFMKEYLPQSRPPTPEEQAIEKQRKGGYAPFSKNYYDEVFEN